MENVPLGRRGGTIRTGREVDGDLLKAPAELGETFEREKGGIFYAKAKKEEGGGTSEKGVPTTGKVKTILQAPRGTHC